MHDAIRKLYADACTINGDTKDTITVWNKNGKEVSIDWDKVQTKATELQTAFETKEKSKETKKTSAIIKLKELGLDDDEISVLIGN